MLFGENFVYQLAAPSGWVLDNTSGARSGLHAVFYPAGGSWEESPAVMYTNTSRLDGSPSLDTYIDQYLKEFGQRNGPGLQVRRATSIKTADGKWARVVQLTGDRWSNLESVAFILDGQLIVFVVLTSRTQNDYRQSLSSFTQLVASYKFLGSSIADLTDVDQIISVAKYNTSSPEGATYDQKVGQYFATWYQKAVAKCVGTASNLPDSNIDIMILANPTPIPQKILVEPQSRSALCLCDALGSAQLPPAPKPDYWVHIRLMIRE